MTLEEDLLEVEDQSTDTAPPKLSKFAKLASLHKLYSNPEHEVKEHLPYDWQAAIAEPMRNQDIQGMKQAGLVANQLHMMHLAHSAESEAVQLDATKFLLSQEGHGPLTRVEHTLNYKKLPPDQLQSIIQAKISSIKRLNPAFNVAALMPPIETESVTLDVSRETLDVSQNLEGEFEEC